MNRTFVYLIGIAALTGELGGNPLRRFAARPVTVEHQRGRIKTVR